MKGFRALLVAALILFVGGCKNLVNDFVDGTPPAGPTGLWTETGDNFIELFWSANRESDVAGYNVFVSGSYDGRMS